MIFFEPILSKYQCGFRKDHNTQHCLFVIIEKWKKCLDNKGVCATLLTDLLTKLNAYCLHISSVVYIKSYLSQQKQKVKMNNTLCEWTDILYGVPQSPILGLLLFNIFLCDLFLSRTRYRYS